MRIEIFVVRTAKDNLNKLEKAKDALIRLFGGLTEIKDCKGYWFNKNGSKITDNVEMWLIYAYNPLFKYRDDAFTERTAKKDLRPILTDVKEATQQQCQAYALNNEIYFI